MAQNSVVRSFRRRAEKLGYRHITVERIPVQYPSDLEALFGEPPYQWYYVRVQEPLAGRFIELQCDEEYLQKALRGIVKK